MESDTARDWVQAFADLPTGMFIAAGVLFVAGLLLWGFGKKIVRPAMVGSAAVIGATAAYVTAGILHLPVPIWAATLAGAAMLGIFAWLSYRPAMGIALALLLGIASPLGVLAWAEIRGVPLTDTESQIEAADQQTEADQDLLGDLRDIVNLMRESDDAIEDVRRGLAAAREQPLDEDDAIMGPPEENPDASNEGTRFVSPEWIAKTKELADALRAEIAAQWRAVRPEVRRSLLLSSASGAILGLLIGLTFPGLSASILTAMAGSAMSLGSGVAVVARLSQGDIDWLPRSIVLWLVIWFAASVTGVAIQWTAERKPADKPQEQ